MTNKGDLMGVYRVSFIASEVQKSALTGLDQRSTVPKG